MLKYQNRQRLVWGTRLLPDKFARFLLSSLVFALVFSLAIQLFLEPLAVQAGSFTSGNLTVLRVGDGNGSLGNAATPVFLDEYSSTGGNPVQSLALPTAVSGNNRILTLGGTATSEGALALSTDGRYLTLAGYDAAPGTASVAGTTSATTNRIVARVDVAGNIDTSTHISDGYSTSNIRGVVTDDGTHFWTAGTGTGGGTRFVTFGSSGASTLLSSSPTNTRVPNIFAGQLYISSASSTFQGLSTVGTGLPTTGGQTTTILPGFPTAGGPSPYAFTLLDLNSSVAGVDTAYVADDRASASGGGIQRWNFDGTTWTLAYTLNSGLGTGARGLTAVNNAGTIVLYATTTETSANRLVTVTDSGASSAFTTLATAQANTVFRGVAFTPSNGAPPPAAPTIVTQPASQTISTGETATLSVTANGAAPLSYQWYQGTSGDTTGPISGASSSSFTTPALTATTSYWVRVTNTIGSADSDTATVTVSAPPPPCSAVDTPIHTVQGSTDISPFSGSSVTVQGVVVGDNEGPSPALRGFYLEDQNPDADPATSEGIFIFDGNANTVSVGQVVQVTGTVSEFQGQTQITATTIETCGTTATIAPVDVTLPVPAPVAGVPYLERFEGMLVRFHQTLYVTEHFQLGRFGQIIMSANSRLPQPTNIVTPGAAAQAQQVANNLNRIIVDDDLNNQNPDPILFGDGGNPLSALNTLRGGDSATDMVGVMTFTWAGNNASGNAYRLRPVSALSGGVPNFQPADPRPAGPPAVGGNLKVASFNVLNYFLTLDRGSSTTDCGPIGSKQECRGAESALELTRQQQKLNQALLKLDGDVVGMMELENTQNAQGQDVNPVGDIVGRLNASLGSDVYSYINTGVIGTDTIRVGIIYKKAKVTPIGSPLIDTNPVHNRPPVAQLFADNSSGERFTVIVNHFKSKSSCPTDPANPDNDQGDGEGCWNQTRVQQAQALISFINGTVIPANADPDVLLIGDFNSYAKEDPIRTLETAGFINQVARFSGAEAYSYVFDGQWGYLDQGLASASLSHQVTGAGDYHINSDEPSVLDYNTNFKSAGQISSLFNADEFRTSDHDPVVLGLNLHQIPSAKDDTYTTLTGIALVVNAGNGIFSNDTGGPFQLTSNTNPGHGTLTLNPDGSFTYVPATGFAGSDSFSYTVKNANQFEYPNIPLDLSTATVTITVVNPAPETLAYNIFTFKNLKLTTGGSQVNGKVGVGGDAILSNDKLGGSGTQGDELVVQGSVTCTNSQINGNIKYGGTFNTSQNCSIKNGSATKAVPAPAFSNYQPGAVAVANNWKALAANGTTNFQYGGLTLTGNNATQNVFKVSGANLASSSFMNITAPAGSTVIINIDGTTDRMQYMGINLSGGIDRQHVVFNFYEAITLTINGASVPGLVWAPQADVTFTNGQLNGSLVAQSLSGGGQFNDFPFKGSLPV